MDEIREWLYALHRADRATAVLVGQGRRCVGYQAGEWSAWYRRAIPLAEARYAVYLKERDQ